MDDAEKRINDALDIAYRYGGIDGAHHKDWIIDQIVRKLLGNEEKYEEWVKNACNGEDGPDTYDWSVGVPP